MRRVYDHILRILQMRLKMVTITISIWSTCLTSLDSEMVILCSRLMKWVADWTCWWTKRISSSGTVNWARSREVQPARGAIRVMVRLKATRRGRSNQTLHLSTSKRCWRPRMRIPLIKTRQWNKLSRSAALGEERGASTSQTIRHRRYLISWQFFSRKEITSPSTDGPRMSTDSWSGPSTDSAKARASSRRTWRRMIGLRSRLSSLVAMTPSASTGITSNDVTASRKVFGAKKKMTSSSRLWRNMVPSIGIR